MSLPEPIPKDGNVPMSWLIFVGRKRSPKHRLRTQNREKILRNGSRSQGFGLRFPGQVQSGVGIDRHFFERTVLIVPIHVIGGGDGKHRHPGKALRRRHMPNLHQLLWIFEWQRPQQRSIDHAENRRVGSYAQSQCQHCDCSKLRRLTDHAQRIANVLYHSVHYSYLSATMGSTLAARRAGM